MEAAEMSLAAYRRLVGTLLDAGYKVRSFDEADPSQRHLILRHDVDLCLDRAVAMAELEADIGVAAHYFVLLNTEMYNANSRRGRAALRRIRECGHSIGLHFDPTEIEVGNVATLQSRVAGECDMLGECSEHDVDVVTFHRPAKWLLGFEERLAGRLHGYQPRFFSEMGYCSDSEGRFRFHHPLSHPSVEQGRALQLVIHPIWWCAEEGESPVQKLERFLCERADRLASEVAINCRPFAVSRDPARKS